VSEEILCRNDTSSHPPGSEQTENHGVSFVSGGARDARMKFRRKLIVCWTEPVMRIRGSPFWSLEYLLGYSKQISVGYYIFLKA